MGRSGRKGPINVRMTSFFYRVKTGRSRVELQKKNAGPTGPALALLNN